MTTNFSYSQTPQTTFFLNVTGYKKIGKYLDFTRYGPISNKNNTSSLELDYFYTGLSVINDCLASLEWNGCPRNSNDMIYVTFDNFNELFIRINEYYTSNIINYLSVYLNPVSSSYDMLSYFPFDKYKSAVITFRHDFCKGFNVFINEREIFLKYGYRKVTKEYMSTFDTSYPPIHLSEDWWIHPDLVHISEEYLDQSIVDLTMADLYDAGLPGYIQQEPE